MFTDRMIWRVWHLKFWCNKTVEFYSYCETWYISIFIALHLQICWPELHQRFFCLLYLKEFVLAECLGPGSDGDKTGKNELKLFQEYCCENLRCTLCEDQLQFYVPCSNVTFLWSMVDCGKFHQSQGLINLRIQKKTELKPGMVEHFIIHGCLCIISV